MKIVIMAGGSGSRLWPKSRKDKPKQFTKVVGGKTMIEDTYARFVDHFSVDAIYFSTIPSFEKRIKELFPDIDGSHIIVEPEKRDNAAAHGYVAAYLSLTDENEPLAFIPSDHYIKDVEKFNITLKVAEEHIKSTGNMLDIAIEPSFPSTVLGYTHIGKHIETSEGVEIYEFLGHTEKPEFSVAKEYVDDGSYLWHGNYYMWTPKKFLEAYKKYAPSIYAHLEKIQHLLKDGDLDAIPGEYAQIEETTIDFAITEKMDPNEVRILKGDFGWSDIGAWDMVHDLLSYDYDQDQNVIKAKHVSVDTSGSYVSAPKGKLIATIGVDDLIIVDTPDALLVCPKSRAQDVKKVVEELKNRGEEDYI
ncbi:hypothetical protein KKH43_06380 [Patescibacteria group bacterium]|nr:hypothetical protein [Patescibacteria group bacterium]